MALLDLIKSIGREIMNGSRSLICALMLASLSGCSVGMALSGDPTPDFDVVKIGGHRDDVELQLGQPLEVKKLGGGGEMVTYSYEVGNDPNAVRAIGHAALDVASVGLWEVVGTPIEASVGDEYELNITYDKQGHVTDLKRVQ